MSISRIEQETVILFNEAEASASVYTYNGALNRKLTGLCHTRPTEARLTKDDGHPCSSRKNCMNLYIFASKVDTKNEVIAYVRPSVGIWLCTGTKCSC